MVGLAWTQTRGATVTMCLAGIFVGFSACGFFRSRRRRWTLRLILLAAVAGFFLHVGRSGAWKAFHPDNIEEAASLRTSLYRNGGEIFQDYPWLGVGLGAFPWAYPAYQTVMLGKQVTHVHSDWLELLLETGFIGLLLYLAGLAGLARRALRAWREAPPGERRCLLGGVLAALLAFLLHQGIEFQFQTPGNAVWFFVLCGFFDAAAPDDIPKAGGTRLAELFSSRPGWTRLGLAALYFGLALAAAKPAVASLYALRSRTAAPASRPYFLSKALAWHASPDYAFELGATYLELAEANPGARTALLRLGLRASSSALAQAPQHPRYRNLQAAIIWRLGRVDDARSLLRAPMAARS
ncbi:MAG: O-antigen ligase family protein [Elusimicrobia bacterium]|nr:O-antigen ligase family protein [Elusimicrobiota bacterium]